MRAGKGPPSPPSSVSHTPNSLPHPRCQPLGASPPLEHACFASLSKPGNSGECRKESSWHGRRVEASRPAPGAPGSHLLQHFPRPLPRRPANCRDSPVPASLASLGARSPTLTCRGSAPAPACRPAAPARGLRPAGRPSRRPAPCPRVPAVPPAARQSLRLSPPPLLSSAAALYPGSRSPLPAGSRTPRLKGTSSFCLGTPSPAPEAGAQLPTPLPGTRDVRARPESRAPPPLSAASSPGPRRTSGHCSGLQTPREGRGARPSSRLHPGRHPAGCPPPSPEGPRRPAKPPTGCEDARPAQRVCFLPVGVLCAPSSPHLPPSPSPHRSRSPSLPTAARLPPAGVEFNN